MAIAQKVAGYSLGQADLLRRAMGKKKKRDPRRGVRRRSPSGMQATRLLRRRDQDAVGHPRPVLRLRVQQGAHRGVRAGLVLDRLPQGQLPGRVHGGAAHQRPRRQGQVRALPRTSAAGWASSVLPPDVNAVRPPTSPRSATTSASAWPPIRNVGAQRRRRDRRGPARRRARYTSFDDFLAQGRRAWSATSARSSR